MVLLAHVSANHWYTSLAMMAPAVAFMVWLAVVTIRERRRTDEDDAGEQEDGA